MENIKKYNESEIKSRIINPSLINNLLQNNTNNNQNEIKTILNKAKLAKGLSLEESAKLLFLTNKDDLKQLFETAKEVKESIYGKRIVFFAPLYLSNYCTNNCTYCAYTHDNSQMQRLKLTSSQVADEALSLLKMGHKRLVLETGEDYANYSINDLTSAIKAIYNTTYNKLKIRRVNINTPASDVETYKILHDNEIGTYILFAESYHEDTYKKYHLSGMKSNFSYHITAHHRAISAGLDDVGLGVLFGLHDYKYEVLSLINHALVLEEDFGFGPHTLSVPRIKKALGIDASYPNAINDDDFLKIIAILRLALPYTGLILSTRESAMLREKALAIGISQISAGSSTSVGGYSTYKETNTNQFSITDERSAVEIASSLLEQGYLPSFCTACYRKNRTGDDFMQLAKSGEIKKVCSPNALITLKEFMLDFCPDRIESYDFDKALNLLDSSVREKTKEYLNKLDKGERDLYL